jgi:hypothetical protein
LSDHYSFHQLSLRSMVPPPLAHSPTLVLRYVSLSILHCRFPVQPPFNPRLRFPRPFISTSSLHPLRLLRPGPAALPSPTRLVKLYRHPTRLSPMAKPSLGAQVPSLILPRPSLLPLVAILPRLVPARTAPRRLPSPIRSPPPEPPRGRAPLPMCL